MNKIQVDLLNCLDSDDTDTNNYYNYNSLLLELCNGIWKMILDFLQI